MSDIQFTPQGSAQVLRNAVRFGLINRPGASDAQLKKVAACLLLNEIDTKDPDLQRPYQNAKSQTYWEHHFNIIEQPDAPPQPQPRGGIGPGGSVLPEWVCELARFPVPFGHIGILKSIDQYLFNGQQTITQSANWGSPYQDLNTGPVRWFLRLDNFNGFLPERFNQINSSFLPGWAYPELPEIDYIWYPVSSPATAINAMIPGGYVLRFFFYAPPEETIGRCRVLGRLRGFYQSVYSPESAIEARTNW